ncbi:MAG TPA: GMC family oxidoreductase N-terminal domain-containing protein [Streptosporangiaceae bacterium]|nr:GMC family oxidoreductase N-terminal domain-containing protein [Streptosporangiaceae bacterium]
MASYDYIVVGGGAAGCVLAARLSEDTSRRVLVLEAGSAERTHGMTVPNAWPENLGSAADWANVTTDQADAGPGIFPRGRTLGGSSAINAMAHVRGHRAIYDRWAAEGASGWSFADLLPYFRRTERADGHDPELRGTNGPIQISRASQPHPVAEAFVQGLADDGFALTDDLSGRRQEGVTWVDLAIGEGERVSAADGYLRPVLGRRGLDVETECLATRLHVTSGRCTGVSYLKDGVAGQADATGEVLLAAGAIGSPQLLMLSGIGPAGHLRAFGIDVIADLPGVGANLQDHPVVLASYSSPSQLPASKYNNGEACAALRSDLAGDYPDLHLFPILLPLAPANLAPPANGYALVASVVAPGSRGTVRLASADPRDAPLIDPAFLTDERDLDRMDQALRIVRHTAAGRAFDVVREAEIWPGPQVSDAAGTRQYIRSGVGSYYHPVGTCKMGSDPAAVVDHELRVHEIEGLRVIDASVFPIIPNAHPNATVLAIAERAADLIKRDHGVVPAYSVQAPEMTKSP